MTKMKNQRKWMSLRVLLCSALFTLGVMGNGLSADAANKTLELSEDASYTSAGLSYYDTIRLNGHKLTVTGDFNNDATITLGTNGELVVNGNMISSKKVDCGNGVLEVNGNYTQTADTFYTWTSSTRVTIKGDVIFKQNGNLYINSSGAKINVGGNISYSSAKNSTTNTGVWTVVGNIIQEKDSGTFNTGSLVLDGTKKQTISLQSNSEVGGVTAKNSKIVLKNYLNGAKLYSDFAPEMTGVLKTTGIDLNGNKFIVPVGLESTGKIALGNNGNLVVNGDFTTSGETYCNNGVLEVNGNYTQTANRLYEWSATMQATIKGDVIFKQTGNLYINSSGAKIKVGGNISYSSANKSTTNTGVWTVAGNITQEKDSGTFNTGSLVLDGTKKQTISLQSNSTIGDLEAQNSQIVVENYLNDAKLKADFAPEITGVLKTTGIDLNGNTFTVPVGLESTGRIKLGNNGHLIVNGDFTTSGETDCNNGVLEVNGNYTQTDNRLYTWSSSMQATIKGDAIFKQNGYLYINNSSAKIKVDGNMSYSSANKSTTNTGVWTIEGNVTQEEGSGSLSGGNVNLPNKGSSVTLPNGSINVLTLSAGKSKYTIEPEGCCKKIVATCVMTFNANGGKVSPKSTKVVTGNKYDSLPTPTKDGYTFDGWFTAAKDGEQIKNGGTVTAVDDFKVYAHWSEAKAEDPEDPEDPENPEDPKDPEKPDDKEKNVTDAFTDIPGTEWYVGAVQFVYSRSIMNGTGDGTFSPLMTLTRGQFVTVLYNMEANKNGVYKSTFSDVKEGAFYAIPVIWAAENNITSGIGDGKFGPDQIITREQLATMLYKYAIVKEYSSNIDSTVLDTYPDKGSISDWAGTGLQWAVTNKVMGGKASSNGNILDPSGKASRAECAQMIKNLMENAAK